MRKCNSAAANTIDKGQAILDTENEDDGKKISWLVKVSQQQDSTMMI